MKYKPEIQEKFDRYIEILRARQLQMNLVAPSTMDNIQSRHIDDSAQLADFLPAGAQIIDLGSGAGFPAVVLAMLGYKVSAIESIAKKANFLEELKSRLNLPNLTIINDRVENYIRDAKCVMRDVQDKIPELKISKNIKDDELRFARHASRISRHVIFTARAFAPLLRIFDWTYNKNTVEAEYILMKGKSVRDEITIAKQKYNFDTQLFPSKTGDGFIVIIKNLKTKKYKV